MKAQPNPQSSYRLSDISRIIRGRYGGPCHTADAARYLMAAIPEMMRTARSWRYAVAWARDWTPNLLDTKGEEFIRTAWAKITARKRLHLTTDQLSRLLKVADDEPARLGLRCIPAASRNAKIRKAERKAKNAQAEATRRLRIKPDLTPRSGSLMATKPWDAAGISRSKWYALRKAETSVKLPAMADLDGFVDAVSDTASGQFRGHQFPFYPFRVSSGQEAPLDRTVANAMTPAERIPPSGAANDDEPRVGPATCPDGWRLQARDLAVRDAVKAYPELAEDIEAHVDAVNALMIRTPAHNRWRVAPNLMKDIGRALRRSRKIAA